MSIQIFSVPQGFTILDPNWLTTPAQANRVNQVAHASLANWTIDQLSSRKTLSAVVGAISGIGLGIAFYMLNLPIIVIGGLSVVICLLGYKAIHREQIARLEKACLAVEDWLIPLKQTCEQLDSLLDPFKGKSSQKAVPLATYQPIYDLIQQLPSDSGKQIKQFADELSAQHLALFGEYHQMGQGQCSTYWITHYFGTVLKSQNDHFYAAVQTFEAQFLKLQQDSQNVDHQTNLYLATHLLYFYKNARQAQLSLVDSIEQSRQSIAAFRSSLTL